MIRILIATSLIGVLACSHASHACGGGFGDELFMGPEQSIILRHDNNEETYVFSPSFCGKSADFGLILPIPDTLTQEPVVVEDDVFEAFSKLTAPIIKIKKKCWDGGRGDGAGLGAFDAGADSNNGVEVVDSGKVDIFDWSLLRADDTNAFTDWLDANQYPYDENAVSHFAYYVAKSWYFIAFKVSTNVEQSSGQSHICGAFGPVKLQFKTSEQVVPTRIAAVGDGMNNIFSWRFYILAPQHVTAADAAFEETVRFRGAITSERLAEFPKVGEIAELGDRLTALNVNFRGRNVERDLLFKISPDQGEYRQTIVRTDWVDCDTSCSVSGKPGFPRSGLLRGGAIVLIIGLLLFATRRKPDKDEERSDVV